MGVKLTDREMDVMSVVWQLGSATVNEVRDRMDDDLAYSTVLTIFRTLTSKGLVEYEQEGKAYRYKPLVSPREAGGSVLDQLIEKVYKGSRELLVSQLVSDEEISVDELKRMRKALDQRLKELD